MFSENKQKTIIAFARGLSLALLVSALVYISPLIVTAEYEPVDYDDGLETYNESCKYYAGPIADGLTITYEPVEEWAELSYTITSVEKHTLTLNYASKTMSDEDEFCYIYKKVAIDGTLYDITKVPQGSIKGNQSFKLVGFNGSEFEGCPFSSKKIKKIGFRGCKYKI